MYRSILAIIVFIIFLSQCKSGETYYVKNNSKGNIEIIIEKNGLRNGPTVEIDTSRGNNKIRSIKIYRNDLLFGDSYFFGDNGKISKYERYNELGYKEGDFKYFNNQGDCIKYDKYLNNSIIARFRVSYLGLDTISIDKETISR